MLHKAFQTLLVTFLILFTAAGLVLIVSPLTSLLRPADTSGIFVVTGGMVRSVFNILLIVFAVLTIGVIYLVSRRSKLR